VATRYLVDTNILLRYTRRHDPARPAIESAIRKLLGIGVVFYYCPQNVVEAWSVLTRPAERNGFGLSPKEAVVEVQMIQQNFAFASENDEIHPMWLRLVTVYGVSGRNVHDARLVATMRVHGISHLLTFNGADFRRFKEITVVHPADVINTGESPE